MAAMLGKLRAKYSVWEVVGGAELSEEVGRS
jgi:hypothetical protein